MKLAHTLYVFFLVALRAMAQDTIHFLNNDIKVVKVEEIGVTDVKYHRLENVTGPMYIAGKREIDYIRFANGQVEKMKNVPGSAPSAAPSAPVSSGGGQFASRIIIKSNRLIYNGDRLSDRAFGELIDKYPKPEIRLRLENEYVLLTQYKRNSVIWKTVVLAVGIGAPVVGTFAYVASQGTTTPGIGLLTSILVGTTGSVLTKMYKNKHKAKLIEMANIYNGTN